MKINNVIIVFIFFVIMILVLKTTGIIDLFLNDNTEIINTTQPPYTTMGIKPMNANFYKEDEEKLIQDYLKQYI